MGEPCPKDVDSSMKCLKFCEDVHLGSSGVSFDLSAYISGVDGNCVCRWAREDIVACTSDNNSNKNVLVSAREDIEASTSDTNSNKYVLVFASWLATILTI